MRSEQVDLSNFLEGVYSLLKPSQVFEGNFDHKWQKTGLKWRGKCPWHDSKSGTAFYLDTQSLTWRCPHCDRGGGALQYLHQVRGGLGSPRGKAFIDLAKELGAIAGVDFPERELTPEQQEFISKVENRQAMLTAVMSFCQRCLVSESKRAIAYLTQERGFTTTEIESLNFGVFPQAERVWGMLKEKGFELADAVEYGLLYESGGEVKSALDGYILIPWNDEHGRILTLYGRWHSKTPPEGKPKTTALRNPGTKDDPWLRSKKSPLYLDRAIAANHRDVIVVEGVLDAAMLQIRGDSRAIAWVAANPSAEQIATLQRCKIESVTFCLDPDGAGDKGTRQGIKRLTEAGIKTYAAPRLPDGIDPDEFVSQHGIEQWHKHIDQRLHGFRFEAQKIIESHQPLTDSNIQSALEESQAFVKIVPDNLTAAVEPFFWQEFRALTGVKLDAATMPVEELKAAVAQYAEISDPYERAIAENKIGESYKIRGQRLERLLHHHEAATSRASVLSSADVAQDLFAKIEERAKNGAPLGLNCGFYDLDAMTQGFQRGDLIVLAGRTSMGKSAFAGNLMAGMAEIHNQPVLMFSMEMEAERVINRLVSAECLIQTGQIISGKIQDNQWDALALAIAKIANLPLFIDESPSPSIEDIEQKAWALKNAHGQVAGIFVDHLQFMDCGGEFRAQEIAKVTKRLKVLARQLDCPVFALSQINRGVESRDNKRPNNSDLKDSGGIEQDADIVMMIYRDEYYRPDTCDRGIAELILTKHRNGPTGTVKLLFDTQYSKFRNLKK